MKIYTVKDEEGNLLPKAILEVENVVEGVKAGKITEVDYGLESVQNYAEKNNLTVAICELSEV